MKKLTLVAAAAGVALIALWSVDFTNPPTTRVPQDPTAASRKAAAAKENAGASSAAGAGGPAHESPGPAAGGYLNEVRR